MNRTITLTGVEPAPLSIRHPLGVKLDLRVNMKQQNGAPVNVTVKPQFVLLPRSRGGVRPYDMEITDAVNGNTRIQIPGSDLQDEQGYNIELYSRETNPSPPDPPIPTGLVAKGALITEGSAYGTYGPLSIINIPVITGPPGPMGVAGSQGPVGSPGMRGSLWYDGSGAPGVIAGAMDQDHYLDTSTGDVWVYSSVTGWARFVPL